MNLSYLKYEYLLMLSLFLSLGCHPNESNNIQNELEFDCSVYLERIEQSSESKLSDICNLSAYQFVDTLLTMYISSSADTSDVEFTIRYSDVIYSCVLSFFQPIGRKFDLMLDKEVKWNELIAEIKELTDCSNCKLRLMIYGTPWHKIMDILKYLEQVSDKVVLYFEPLPSPPSPG